MSPEANKDLVRRFYREAINERDSGACERLFAEGDLVAAHQRWSGTHEGEFLGIAATGRHAKFTSTAVLRVRDGQISQAWDEVDVAGLQAQLSS